MVRLLHRTGVLVAVIAGALSIALVAGSTSAGASQRPTLVHQVTAASSGSVVAHHGSTPYRVSWSHQGGQLQMSVTSTGLSRAPAKIAHARDTGIVHPMWWGCVPAVTGAILTVGAALIAVLVVGGGPLDLGFLTIGPETLKIIATAMGSTGAIEDVVARYVC